MRSNKHEQDVAALAKKDLLNEEAHNNYKKYVFIQEAQQVMQMKKDQKELERQQKQQDRLDYQNMCKDRFQSEEAKENQYKQFFKDYEQSMNQRMYSHINHVLKEDIKKQCQLDQLENDAERKYKQKQEEVDLQQYVSHQKALQNTYRSNKGAIDFKQRLCQQQKKEK
uniref:Uncharacterized protein n=1 Tax=Euplotes harpa TaxID=151035 RepID=A0A7S3JEB8_9SPIT|mmetsp:Transcript_35708/g.41339  ORF Transcript_35708/g.41339 Transcript_35708/m.41339 type:complete len:168 (+) Transcript_35708:24-527(+)